MAGDTEPRNLRTVLFLGAGVSKSLGIPLMNEFVDAIRDRNHTFPERIQVDHLDALLSDCASMSTMLGANIRNLENLVSFLEALKLLRPTTSLAGGALNADSALSLIRSALKQITMPPIRWPQLENMCSLLDRCDDSLTIITTNYDLHVETAAYLLATGHPQRTNRAARLQLSPLVVEALHEKANWLADHSTPMLLKLHGSCNWDYSQEKLTCWYWWNVKQDDGRKDAQTFPLWLGVHGHEVRNPLIVAPSYNKEYRYDVIREQWTLAAKAISQADRLYFCGYSFPNTDYAMRFAIAAACHQNLRLRQIVIADPSPATLARASDLFSSPFHREILLRWRTNWDGSVAGHIIGQSASIPEQCDYTHSQLVNLIGDYLTHRAEHQPGNWTG